MTADEPRIAGARGRRTGAGPGLHLFLGTKAEYIKVAPLIDLMKARGLDYRLIDSGQKARTGAAVRVEFGLGEPDFAFRAGDDVNSIVQAVGWLGRLLPRLATGSWLRRNVFGGSGGACLVHGDTYSTLLGALMARRAGLRVAHLEAGLRSHSFLHPRPEEAVRLTVMRLADLLLAPDEVALQNLRDMKLHGRVAPTPGNTSLEALRMSLGDEPPKPASGPAIATIHRVENLRSKKRLAGFLEIVETLARRGPVHVVLHPPSERILRGAGLDRLMAIATVETMTLLPHKAFVRSLAAAPVVVTDGGGIQEECALLGVPTLIWRKRTERMNGLGHNIVLARHDLEVAMRFLAEVDSYRKPPAIPDVHPSEIVLAELLALRDED